MAEIIYEGYLDVLSDTESDETGWVYEVTKCTKTDDRVFIEFTSVEDGAVFNGDIRAALSKDGRYIGVGSYLFNDQSRSDMAQLEITIDMEMREIGTDLAIMGTWTEDYHDGTGPQNYPMKGDLSQIP